MFTSLAASTVCEVHEVDPIDVDNGKGLGASLGVRTLFGRVVTKLENVTGFPKRGSLKIKPSPFLCPQMRQNCTRQTIWHGGTYLYDVEGVKGMDPTQAARAKELHPKTIETAVLAIPAAELAFAIGKHPATFKSDGFS